MTKPTIFVLIKRMQYDGKYLLYEDFQKERHLHVFYSATDHSARASKYNPVIMAAVSSSEDSSENTSNTKVVLGDLLTELNLDFCAQDFANYIKVDISSQVVYSLRRSRHQGEFWGWQCHVFSIHQNLSATKSLKFF